MIQLAVWGNSGAGKSVFACALANQITMHGKNVIVISTDRVTPMLPVYLPLLEDKAEYSLGRLLSGAVREERLRYTVHIHPQNNHLGFMALSGGENGLTYQTGWQTDTIRQLAQYFAEHEMADAIVFDCTPDVLGDAATLYALEKSNVMLQVTSADVRGVTFLNSQTPILRGGEFCRNVVSMLSNTYEYSPVEQLKKDYDVGYVLPHSRGVHSKFCGGELLHGFDDAAGIRFSKEIKQIYQKVVKPLE